MKNFTGIFILVLGIAAYFFFAGPAEVSTADLEYQIRTFLTARTSCKGTYSIENLSEARLGKFRDEVKAWEVSAKFQERCDGKSSSDSGAREGKSPLAYARKNAAGNLEIFMPEIFDRVQK